MRIVVVAGARPNFVKVASLMRAFEAHPLVHAELVHTGQHFDDMLSGTFLRELGLGAPHHYLGIAPGPPAAQFAEIMQRFAPLLGELAPDAVLVVGDVTSTVAGAMAAVQTGHPCVHVEAGLRSFDRSMPEEMNRIVTDSISDLLFVSEPSGSENLAAEGIDAARVRFVGNVMIDSLLQNQARAESSPVLHQLGLDPGEYALATLHRPANVDDAERLTDIVGALEQIHYDLPLVLPAHPRTLTALAAARLDPKLRIIQPLGYLDFLKLLTHARLVLTDSGGIQEEATVLQTPCLTLRDNTERPVTLTVGGNRLVGTRARSILAGYAEFCANPPGEVAAPPLWDGHAASRIADELIDWWQQMRRERRPPARSPGSSSWPAANERAADPS